MNLEHNFYEKLGQRFKDKRFFKYLRTVTDFFRYNLSIFTKLGFIVYMIILGIALEYWDVIKEINSAYELAIVGGDVTNEYVYSSISMLGMTIVGLGVIYLVYFLVAGLVSKLILRLFLRNNSKLIIRKNGEVVFKLKKLLVAPGLYLVILPKIKNETCDKDLRDDLIPRIYNRKNEFKINNKDYNTGVYSFEEVVFGFFDSFNIFEFKVRHKLSDKVIFTVQDKKVSGVQEKESERLTVSGCKTVLARDALEGYFSTREYKPGDEVKRIHWKNTARTQKLMLRIPEDKPIDRKELNIVVNCYTPLTDKFNQHVSISRFMNNIVEHVLRIKNNTNTSLTVHFNTKNPVKIENFEKYVENKIPDILIKAMKFQDETNISQYLENRNLSNISIYTLSSDYSDTENPQFLVHKISKDLPVNLKQLIKYVLIDKDKYDFPNLRAALGLQGLSEINPGIRLIRFSQLVRQNEKKYANKSNVEWLND